MKVIRSFRAGVDKFEPGDQILFSAHFENEIIHFPSLSFLLGHFHNAHGR